MPTPLGHEEFFTSLTTLLTSTSQKSRGSVYLTQTPLLHTSSETAQQSQPSILIRASDGNTSAPNPKTHPEIKDKKKKKETKVKLSTVVQPAELEAFYARYAEVCKAGMTGLKKRDRKLRKAKAKGAGAGKVTKA
ncbi:signal recognition particle, SRP9/SRP14 subunit [Aspergillus karnatakaensis]|uniref:signal recognition particle 14 kDa protein n=1 Tax=Aspergillus karnatakaensis TaxID=1810916 RepID=UPI003CCCEE47